jgi:hypothetical protein
MVMLRLKRLDKLKKFIHLIVSPTRDFAACSIVHQPLRYRVPRRLIQTSLNFKPLPLVGAA